MRNNSAIKLPELLAPAGSFETLDAAFGHGADAVYLGIGAYNLRTRAPNFEVDDISEIMQRAAEGNKKVYAVFNTMPYTDQLAGITKLLREIADQPVRPHGFIISDPGVLMLFRAIMPDAELHLSTQTGVFNAESVKFWADQGIARIVLPREMNLDMIRAVNDLKLCETEIFVHGAMCMSLSGRCLMGAYMYGRHPNQGDCPQPCRFKYRIVPIKCSTGDEGEPLDVEEDESGTYIMNAKDLNTLSILPKIIASGVHSLKIEGRNKSVHYVSSVVKAYRQALDSYAANPEGYRVEESWSRELDAIDHRTYTTGFFDGARDLQDYAGSKAEAAYRVVGVVKGVVVGGEAVVDVKNPFKAGDTLHVLPISSNVNPFTVTVESVTDINGNVLDRALTNRVVVAKCSEKLAIGDMVRVMVG